MNRQYRITEQEFFGYEVEWRSEIFPWVWGEWRPASERFKTLVEARRFARNLESASQPKRIVETWYGGA
jgi:hypothetical protein